MRSFFLILLSLSLSRRGIKSDPLALLSTHKPPGARRGTAHYRQRPSSSRSSIETDDWRSLEQNRWNYKAGRPAGGRWGGRGAGVTRKRTDPGPHSAGSWLRKHSALPASGSAAVSAAPRRHGDALGSGSVRGIPEARAVRAGTHLRECSECREIMEAVVEPGPSGAAAAGSRSSSSESSLCSASSCKREAETVSFGITSD